MRPFFWSLIKLYKSKNKQLPKWSISAEDAKLLNRLLEAGDYANAEPLMDRLVAGIAVQDLGYDNLVNYARLKMENNKPGDAEKIASMAIGLDDQKTAAPEVLFSVYLKQNLFSKALDLIKRLLEVEPQNIRYAYYKILALASLNDSDQVLVCYDDLLARSPEYKLDPQLHHAVINALVGDGRYQEASRRLSDAKELITEWNAWLALVEPSVLLNLGKTPEALMSLDESVEKNPENAIWKWNRALTKLSIGDLDGGWDDYESRWLWKEFPSPKRELNLPLWRGESLTQRSLVISAEQGIGDQIMFGAAIAAVLRQNPTKVRIEVQQKIVPLFELWYPETEVVAFINDRRADEQLEREYDFHVPMATMAGYFFRDPENIEKLPRRRLRVSQGEQATMLGSFAEKYPVKIGVSWRSHAIDGVRKSGYMSVGLCERILESLPQEVGVVIVQYKFEEFEKQRLQGYPNVFIPKEDLFEDPLSNGKYCGCCDLVVSAGTAVVPLAGLFSVPTITWGLKDSWVDLGRKQFPWFPNIHKIQYDHYADKGSIVSAIIEKLRVALANLSD